MENLNSLTVVELKRLLREQGLTVSGNKSELISRLEEPQEKFIVIDEEETTTIVKENPKEILAERTIEKIETYCRSCRATLRYPSDYHGALRCPKCKREFKVNPNLRIGSILSLSSIAVLMLTPIIMIITATPGVAGVNYGPVIVMMGGLTLSGILFGSALLYSLAKKLFVMNV